jgi:hypothetical protein
MKEEPMAKKFQTALRKIEAGAQSAEWKHGTISRLGRGMVITLLPDIAVGKFSTALRAFFGVKGIDWVTIWFDDGRVLEIRPILVRGDYFGQFECIFRLNLPEMFRDWTVGSYADAFTGSHRDPVNA